MLGKALGSGFVAVVVSLGLLAASARPAAAGFTVAVKDRFFRNGYTLPPGSTLANLP